ncbi:MAG: monofunctional biosynthetic peptidoglycan transglycosylase [Bdellovibrio sp. 28-41-41]|nr:MAG: monofunctional biosynthetic peptidoglycan transglycosylase [Bdellovibrio sp. 28-41-41]
MKSTKILLISFGLIFFLVLGFAIRVYMLIPDREDLMSCFTTKMYEVKLCPGGKNYVPLNQISKVMQKTVILTEDSLFYTHKGFDWESIEKSAKENLDGGKYKRGGSTITQQLAKNLYLTRDKTLIRKLTEAFITLQIEKHLTKNEILEKYLNVVEFGKDLYGVKTAAWHYFKKTPAQLDVVESAFLAMLLPSPKKYARSFYAKQLTPFAFKRIRRIVSDMYQYNRITDEQYTAAKAKLRIFYSTPDQVSEIDTMDEQDNSAASEEDSGEDSSDSSDQNEDQSDPNLDGSSSGDVQFDK